MSGAKRKFDQLQSDRLYTPKWECPICMDELGVDAGVIPCVITSCRPVAHIVCYKCAQKPELCIGARCPLCRTPIASILPIGAFVDEGADAEARVTLNNIAASRIGLVEERRIIARRVLKIVDRITAAAARNKLPRESGKSSLFWWSKNLPSWEKRWRLRGRVHGLPDMNHAEIRSLCAIEAHKCNLLLNQIYEGTPYRVRMSNNQVHALDPNNKPVYLRFYVTRR